MCDKQSICCRLGADALQHAVRPTTGGQACEDICHEVCMCIPPIIKYVPDRTSAFDNPGQHVVHLISIASLLCSNFQEDELERSKPVAGNTLAEGGLPSCTSDRL